MTFLILDTEYTSWEGAHLRNWSGQGEYKELVQLSCIKMRDIRTFNGSEFLSLYTKPKLNPVLSDYFQSLTGINQQLINEVGLEIIDAIQLFSDFSEGLHCFSWENDIAILEENIKLLSTEPSLCIKKHTDIRLLFEHFGVHCSHLSSGEIDDQIPGASIISPGNRHNALSDCVSIVSAINKLGCKYGFDNVVDVMSRM